MLRVAGVLEESVGLQTAITRLGNPCPDTGHQASATQCCSYHVGEGKEAVPHIHQSPRRRCLAVSFLGVMVSNALIGRNWRQQSAEGGGAASCL